MEADHSAAADPEGQQALNFFQELRRRAAAWPGVTALSYTASLPIDSVGSDGSYDVEGLPILPFSSSATQHANFRLVGPDYFSTLGVDSRAGRQLDGRDVAGAAKTVVINEAMARATWPGQSPLGRRIRCGWYSGTQEWMTIVGIVADTRQSKLDAPIGQELYIPAAQHPRLTRGLKIVARTALDPLALAEGFRRTAQAIDPQVPVRFTTAELMVGQTLAAPRFRALLIGLFAAVALLLAVVGVAGVMAYLVAERRMEIGIRMAIGATPAGILRQFLLRGLGLALVGLALGLVGAVASARLLQGLLFGISATDPRTIAVVSAILVIAALAATAWPALQASRQSPMVALRAD
jgi:predicted permease